MGSILRSRSRWRDVIWANQWEPSTKTQHACDCYRAHFGSDILVNEDIDAVLDQTCPEHDLLVGGFPCQDYSVAKTLNQAHGIEGKKGVLWWAIYQILEEKRPRLVFLENVDRLLKSPSTQRGRDFAIILACLVGPRLPRGVARRERRRLRLPATPPSRLHRGGPSR